LLCLGFAFAHHLIEKVVPPQFGDEPTDQGADQLAERRGEPSRCFCHCFPSVETDSTPRALGEQRYFAHPHEARRLIGVNMATYVLIHGSSSDSWYWHRVVPALRRRGHDVVAPDLPSDDDSAGLSEYADAVVDAIGDRRDLVVVAQSLGGFTAPLVCNRVPVSLVVLVAAMVPVPGESVGDWFANTGWAQARREQAERNGREADEEVDLMEDFFHDVPPEVVAEAFAKRREAPIRYAVPRAVASRCVAERADKVRALSRRSLLSGRFHAPSRTRAPWHHTGRHGERPLARAQPP
jgi:pimeloyl-ACP methyl ester carboxylesterase